MPKVPYGVGVARYREIARGQLLGDTIGTGATELVYIGQAVLALGDDID